MKVCTTSYLPLSILVKIWSCIQNTYKLRNSGNVKVERIVRENNIYDGKKSQNFLKDANLDDPITFGYWWRQTSFHS